MPVTEERVLEMALSLAPTVRTARQASYATAAAYLVSEDIPEADIPDLQPFTTEHLRNILQSNVERQRTPDGEPVTEKVADDVLVRQTAQKAVEGSLSRVAQEPAREVVAEVAETTEGIGWARMLTGATSCSFCAMLASRGPVYSSEQAAIGRGGSPLTAYHTAYLNKNGKLVGGNCDCIAVLVKDRHWEGWDAADELEYLWMDSIRLPGEFRGRPRLESGKGARNAFRRNWVRKVRSGETGDYVAESMKK